MSDNEEQPKITKQDKRKITARQNLERARVMKREQQLKQKELKERVKKYKTEYVSVNRDLENDSDGNNDSSENEEDEIIYRVPSKNKKKKKSKDNEIAELKQMIQSMQQQQGKRKSRRLYILKKKNL